MKKLLLFGITFLPLFICVLLSSCSEDEGNNGYAKQIVGTWLMELADYDDGTPSGKYDQEWTFLKNGTGYSQYPGDKDHHNEYVYRIEECEPGGKYDFVLTLYYVYGGDYDDIEESDYYRLKGKMVDKNTWLWFEGSGGIGDFMHRK